MQSEPASRSQRFRMSGRAAGTAVVVTGLLVSLSLAFATASQTGEYAENADTMQRSADVLTTTAVIRADLGVVLVLGRSGANGLVVTDLEDAVAALESTVDALTDRVGEWEAGLGGSRPEVADALDAVAVSVTKAAASLRSGDIDRAEDLSVSDVLPRLDDLSGLIIETRDETAGRLRALRNSAGTLARLASIGVALMVPAIAFFGFRRAMRRRQRQETLQLKLRQERQLVRTKDEFIANLSHELRTPLTGIFGFAMVLDDMLASRPVILDHEMLAETTGVILSEASELNRMVDDLLAAAKAEGNVLNIVHEELSIGGVVEASLDLFRRQHVSLSVDLEEATVVADRHHVGQVVRNLVSNADKHGGPHRSIEGRIEEDRYLIRVMDDGAGVPDELVDRLFTRFVHRGDTPLTTGSVGLGLYISAMLAEAMGGDLAYSRADGISTFALSLPMTSAQTIRAGADSGDQAAA